MKTRLPSLIALVFLALLSPGFAEVLIYKGTVRLVALGPPVSIPPVLNIFLVFDPATGTLGVVRYFTQAGKKTFIQANPSPYNVTSVPVAQGGTATVIATSDTFDNGTNFSHSIVLFRGKQSTLVIASGVGGSTANQPVLFVGHQLGVSESGGASNLSDFTYRVRFQSAKTIAANDAHKTAQQVVDDLAQSLSDKGYSAP